MNTYDFDKTIFYPDSSYCFYLYCLRHYPGAMVKTLPRSVVSGLRYAAGKGNTKMLKEQLFSFLPNLPDVDGAVKDFWEENRHRLAKWYLPQKRSDDVIISASPEFLLRPICDELGVQLIGTRMIGDCRVIPVGAQMPALSTASSSSRLICSGLYFLMLRRL